MKKQSHGYNPDRQDVASVTPFPGQSLEGSKPRGLHDHNHSQPTHLKKGAAESRTVKPVDMPHGEEKTSLAAESSKPANTSPGVPAQTTPGTTRRRIA